MPLVASAQTPPVPASPTPPPVQFSAASTPVPVPVMMTPTPPPAAGIPPIWSYYRPVAEDFWDTIKKYMADENWSQVVNRSADRIELVKKDSLDAAEARVIAAYAMYRLGFTYGATEMYAEAIRDKIGSAVAERALAGIEEIAKEHPVDSDFVYGEILNDVEFGVLPSTLQDFVSYFNGLFNVEHGFNKWGEAEIKRVSPDSFWGFKLKYNKALEEVENKRIDEAIAQFKTLMEHPLAPEAIKNDATHQYARLLFEKGDYVQSYKTFKLVKLDLRERGFILLERAWARYYQKDYSKALGLLQAYEAPMFDGARTPEAYVLRMLMYKELCHYDAALETMAQFNQRYEGTFKAIKKRKELRKDPLLVNMALMDHRYEPWASFLNVLRSESKKFDELGWKDYEFYEPTRARYKAKMQEVEARLGRLLEDKTRDMANLLLDWQEQMTFLDYQTRLDSLRVVRRGDELQYKSATIPGLTFDKIYWIFRDEYWIDELEDMKSFIESRCSGEGESVGE